MKDHNYETIKTTLSECRDALYRVEQLMHTNNSRINPEISAIKRLVCEHCGVTLEGIDAPGRPAEIVWARHLAMYLSRELTSEHYRTIAKAFNKKDHVTVINACRQVRDRISTCARDADVVEKLRLKLAKKIAFAV